MTTRQLKNAVEKHKRFIDISSRAKAIYACQFVEDLLFEELDYLLATNPEVSSSIVELANAMKTVKRLWNDIDNMETDDIIKAKIWTK